VLIWQRGGCSGSIARIVRREIRDHIRGNPVARRSRYPLGQRLLRLLLAPRSFASFILAYLLLDLAAVDAEGISRLLDARWLPRWSGNGVVAAHALLSNVPSFLVTVQVGVLGVISLALALITLIANRDDGQADIQVYYHESMFFEISASCIALLAVLCVQFLWPLQFLYHLLGGGSSSLFFKIVLLCVHISWLCVNLAGLAYFIEVTFRFVQRGSRETMRERYTANVALPAMMRRHLWRRVYAMAGDELLGSDYGARPRQLPCAHMGHVYEHAIVEVRRTVRGGVEIADVRTSLLRWALTRWTQRCMEVDPAIAARAAAGNGDLGPLLFFPPRKGLRVTGEVILCQRRGGVPLTFWELRAIRFAFRFKKWSDDA